MKLWIAQAAGFSQALCIPANENSLSFRMSVNEGQAGEIEYEQVNRGWRVSFDRPSIVVAWSPTGLAADARMLARGTVYEATGDLLGPRQTVRARCAPSDIDAKLLAWAKQNLADGPATDFALGGDEDTLDSYLDGRSGDLGVDPRSHSIFYSDSISGSRVVDLRDVLLEDLGIGDGVGSFDAPRSLYRMQIEAGWTQIANGVLNAANQIPDFTTYNSDPGSILQAIAVQDDGVDSGANFTVQSTDIVAKIFGSEGIGIPIDGYAARYQTEVRVEKVVDAEEIKIANPDGPEGFRYSFFKRFEWTPIDDVNTKPVDGPFTGIETPLEADTQTGTWDTPVTPTFAYERLRVDVQELPIVWDLNQERSEKVTIELRCDYRGEATPEADDEIRTFTVGTQLVVPDGTEFDVSKSYKAGDVVLTGQRRWRALQDSTGGPIDPLGSTWTPEHGPEELDEILIGRTTSEPTEVGRRVIENGLLRLRREARRRLRTRNLTFYVPWSVGGTLGVDDSARISIPWTDSSDRAIVGKIVALEFAWDGLGDPLCQVTLGVVPYGLQSAGGGTDRVDDVSYLVESRGAQVSRADITDIARQARSGRNVFFPMATVINEANVQENRMRRLAFAGGDPAQAPVQKPTTITIKGRELLTAGAAVKEGAVVGYLGGVGGII